MSSFITSKLGESSLEAPYRVFDYRFNSAEQNLQGLRTFIDLMQARADGLINLRGKLEDVDRGMQKEVDKLRKHLDEIRNRAATANPAADLEDSGLFIEFVSSLAKAAQSSLVKLTKELAEAREIAKKISVLKTDPQLLKSTNSELISSTIQYGQKELGKLPKGSGPAPWSDLQSLSILWTDYLDYLAGLSLRHDGLDNGMCDIADELIHELQSEAANMNALAIPGRDGPLGVPVAAEPISLPKGAGGEPEASPQPLAGDSRRPPNGRAQKGVPRRVVYLRFPEWTIWALPLTAHELWHIARRRWGTAVYTFYSGRDMPADRITNDEPLHDHLADTFATCVMGPAYSAAALLLSLDPLSKRDRDRAGHLLYVLKNISAKEKGAFDLILSDLTRLWNQALEETGAAAPPALVDKDLDSWTKELTEYLTRIRLRFPTESWGPVRLKWSEFLRDGGPEIDLDEGANLRFALAAAWKARIDKPSGFQIIAERCKELCLRIINKSHRASPPTPQPNWTPLS